MPGQNNHREGEGREGLFHAHAAVAKLPPATTDGCSSTPFYSQIISCNASLMHNVELNTHHQKNLRIFSWIYFSLHHVLIAKLKHCLFHFSPSTQLIIH
jgi:hypothetical protein